ncbi:hypothetical protein CCYA_CCYA01G0372 [Cyanidiococcus yangmingshanensis]|nr:hypothetical protein CCYA_CCYA01G0372 [Cyanidiococcus yangmingshanensis]
MFVAPTGLVLDVRLRPGSFVVGTRLETRAYICERRRRRPTVQSLKCAGFFGRKRTDESIEQTHLRDTYDPLPLHTALLPPKTNAERARAILQAHLNGSGIPLDVNAVDRERRTALHIAAALGLAELVEMLVRAGADVNVQDSQGLTALHMACGYARPTTVRALVRVASESLQLDLRDSRNRTAQQLVQELLAQEQPRKFGGLVRNTKHEAYSEIVSILEEFGAQALS